MTQQVATAAAGQAAPATVEGKAPEQTADKPTVWQAYGLPTVRLLGLLALGAAGGFYAAKAQARNAGFADHA
jgi:hypothetical protein